MVTSGFVLGEGFVPFCFISFFVLSHADGGLVPFCFHHLFFLFLQGHEGHMLMVVSGFVLGSC